MQKIKIIIDTSSWINVFRVDLTNYLIENFPVLVTSKVKEEILRKVLKEEVIDKAKEVLKDAGNKAKRGI